MNALVPNGSAIELAHEADFHLGAMVVRPSTCLVAWDGGQEILQAQVMKVLVALGRRRGQVLSSNDLVQMCWNGRIVGEDAIQRCIARLRKLGEISRGFSIHTVPRVGYRLETDGDRVATGPTRALTRSVVARGSAVLLTGLALASAVAFGGVGEGPVDGIYLEEFGARGGVPSVAVATKLRKDLIDTLGLSRITVASGEVGLFSRLPPHSLRAEVDAAGGRVDIQVELIDRASGTTVWNRHLEGPEADRNDLSLQAAVATARTYNAINELKLQPGLALEPALVALHLRGSDLVRNPQTQSRQAPLEIFREMAERQPDSAVAHAMLALQLVNSAAFPEDARRVAAEARREADRAIELEPAAAGAAYDALYFLHRAAEPTDIVGAEAILRDAIAHAPEFPYLWMRECRLQAAVGRAREAVRFCQRATALAPLAEPIDHSLARALFTAGDRAMALEVIDQAARYNPDHITTQWTRLVLTAFGGRPEQARRAWRDVPASVLGIDEEAKRDVDTFLRGFGRWPKSERDRLAASFVALARDAVVASDFALPALAAMGKLDEAFLVAGSDGRRRTVESNVLFQPATAPMRADPRFWPLAAELGLTDYWRTMDAWPEFCGSGQRRARCKRKAAEAERLATSGVTARATSR